MTTATEETQDRTYALWAQETTIYFNKAEKTAIVYTHERTWQEYYEKTLKLKPINVWGKAREYEVPKSWVKMPKPPKKVSEAQKANLIKARVAKVATKNQLKSEKTINTKGFRRGQK